MFWFLDSLPVQIGSLLHKIGAAREVHDLVKYKERRRLHLRSNANFP